MAIFDKLNLRGLLQDEEFLFGAGLLSAGSQGQNLGQAAFPQLIRAAKTADVFQQKQNLKDVQDEISKMNTSGFTDLEKAIIKVDPIKGYSAIMKNKKLKTNRLLTDPEVADLKLPAGTIVQQDEKGKLNIVSKPSSEDLKKRTQYKNTVGLLDTIEKRYFELNKPVGGMGGFGFDVDRIKGQVGRLTGSKKGKEYSKLVADIDKTTTFLTQAISGAAVSEQEAKRIRALIPQLDDTEVVFEAKLESLRKYLNDARKNHGGDISKHMESVNAADYYKKPNNDSLEKLSDEELMQMLELYK
tara:strand:+ start:307 stop:1206 length:900 start_codon:yes stop_codon:yes gene_type:complete